MNNKRAFFIVGSEGSGTYMLAEALVEAGCFYIPEEMEQDLERVLKLNIGTDVVIRRSIPHAGEFIDYCSLASTIWHSGFKVKIIGIVREPHATIESVYNRINQDRKEIQTNVTIALTELGLLAKDYDMLPITYEAITQSRGFQQWFFNELGLDMPGYSFYDGNAKYYSEGKDG